jgi:hypothetical protein
MRVVFGECMGPAIALTIALMARFSMSTLVSEGEGGYDRNVFTFSLSPGV